MKKLKAQGFDQYPLVDILSYERLNQDLAELTESFEYLPEDPYAKGLNRFRRYSSCHFTEQEHSSGTIFSPRQILKS